MDTRCTLMAVLARRYRLAMSAIQHLAIMSVTDCGKKTMPHDVEFENLWGQAGTRLHKPLSSDQRYARLPTE